MSEAPSELQRRAEGRWPPPLGAFPVTVTVAVLAVVVYAIQVFVGGGVGFEGLRSIASSPLLLVVFSPLLHASIVHLGYNLVFFIALSPAAERRLPAAVYLAGVLSVGWLTNAAPAILPGGTDFAVGLSGVTHAIALFVLPFVLDGAIRGRGRRRVANQLGAALIAVVAIHTFLMALGRLPIGAVAVQSHLAGLAIGSLASFAVAPQFRSQRR